MSDRRRQHLADEAADLLAGVAVHLARVEDGRTVMDRIREAQGGVAASRSDVARIGGHQTVLDEHAEPMPAVTDPTGEAAVNAVMRGRDIDRASQLQRELDRLLAGIRSDAGRVEAILAAYPPPRVADAAAAAQVTRDNTTEATCERCARILIDGHPASSAPDSRWQSPVTLDGKLEAPMWLCNWHVETFTRWGRLATDDETRLHLEGHRVFTPADAPREAS